MPTSPLPGWMLPGPHACQRLWHFSAGSPSFWDTQVGLPWLRNGGDYVLCLEGVGKARLQLASPARYLLGSWPARGHSPRWPLCQLGGPCHLEALGLRGKTAPHPRFPSLGVPKGFGLAGWQLVPETVLEPPLPGGPPASLAGCAAGG